jgi:hypothetical protein
MEVKGHHTLSSSIAIGDFSANVWDMLQVQPGQPAENQQWVPINPPGSGEVQLKMVFVP